MIISLKVSAVYKMWVAKMLYLKTNAAYLLVLVWKIYTYNIIFMLEFETIKKLGLQYLARNPKTLYSIPQI